MATEAALPFALSSSKTVSYKNPFFMKSYASSVLLEEHKAAKYAAKQFSVGSVLYLQQLISRSGYFSVHFTIQSVGSPPYVEELGEEDSYLSGGILSVLLLWRLCIFLST